MNRTCECGNEIVLTGKPGRPPKKCDKCRTEPTILGSETTRKKLNPLEMVDRLEQKLKSRGLHISQHRKDEE